MEEDEYDFISMSLKDLKALESLTISAIHHYETTSKTPGLTEDEIWQFQRCKVYSEEDLKKIQEEIKKREST